MPNTSLRVNARLVKYGSLQTEIQRMEQDLAEFRGEIAARRQMNHRRYETLKEDWQRITAIVLELTIT